MLRNIIGPILTLELAHYFVSFSSFFENHLRSAGRTRFSKTKKNKKMDQFLTHRRANLGPVFSSTYIHTYIYIYICMCMLWSYYMVQVWPFQGLLSGPSCFFQTLFVIKHYQNRGFSTLKNCAQKKIRGYYLVQVCVFKRTHLGPDNNPSKCNFLMR